MFLCSNCSFADEWDNFADLDSAWDGQKTITNKEFDEVMDALQTGSKKKEEKQKKRKIKKVVGGGNSLHQQLSSDKEVINNIPIKENKDGVIINIPVALLLDGKTLDKGYYKVIGERNDNKVHLLFYQSQFLKGKVEATETEDDFDEKEVDFAKLLPYNESFMKIIFGSLDFNAYGFIPYVEDK